MTITSNTTLLGLIGIEDRSLADREREELVTYAKAIQQRKTALLDIQKIEHQAAVQCIDVTHKAYPRFARFHHLGKEKGVRDMQLLLGAAAKAMFLNDIKYFNDHVLIWVRTIFRSLNFTPKFMLDTCNNLRDAVKRYASANTYQLMEPVLAYMTEFLCDIPEPAMPEV